MLTGTFIYQMYLKSYELRTLIYINFVLGIFSIGVELFQIFRFNLSFGISDMAMLCFGSSVLAAFQFALSQLPAIVLFQKLTPPHVETTMMAFSMSVVNLTMGFTGNIIGVFINKVFVGVTSEDLSKFYLLSLISVGFYIYQFFLIRLIPTRVEIDAAVRERKEQRDSAARASIRNQEAREEPE
jgi:hypothetical protein